MSGFKWMVPMVLLVWISQSFLLLSPFGDSTSLFMIGNYGAFVAFFLKFLRFLGTGNVFNPYPPFIRFDLSKLSIFGALWF